MARKPNYQFDRLERERKKAAKKAAKLEAKQAARDDLDADDDALELEVETTPPVEE